MPNHAEVMRGLKSSLYELTKPLKYKKVIYIDYPIHHNIGDLLIYLGSMELLKGAGYEILAQFTATNANAKKIQTILDDNAQEVSLIFHGGGNFGDIYTAHQDCRLSLISQFSKVNTVIFPQTIFYSDQVKKENDIKIFRKHQDLSIATRDIKSQAIAKEFCDNVTLFPDTAHMLWQNEFKTIQYQNTSNKTLKLNRFDGEGDNASKRENFDWALIIRPSDRYFKSLLNRFSALNKLILADKVIAYLWLQHCKNICNRAAKYFAQYSEIETNRLHGHILSCLLSIPNTVLDNNYGKNSTYVDQWTKDSDLVSSKSIEE